MNGKTEILLTQAWNGLIGPILLNGKNLQVKNCSRLIFWSNNCLKKEKIYPGLSFHTFTWPQNYTFDPLDWRDWYLIRSALVQLGSGLALFDLLGCLRGDVNSANGLTIGIKGSTSVLTCRKRKVLCIKLALKKN